MLASHMHPTVCAYLLWSVEYWDRPGSVQHTMSVSGGLTYSACDVILVYLEGMGGDDAGEKVEGPATF